MIKVFFMSFRPIPEVAVTAPPRALRAMPAFLDHPAGPAIDAHQSATPSVPYILA